MGSQTEDISNNVNRNGRQYSSSDDAALFSRATVITTAHALSMAMKAAVELDVFEIIAQHGPNALLSAAEIASKFPTTNPRAADTVDRVLKYLVSHEVLTCSQADGGDHLRYGLAPVCRFFTKNQDGVSLAALVLMNQHNALLDSWQLLKDAVLEGVIPFNKAHGMSAFEYHGKDPKLNQLFNQGMSSHSSITVKKMLDTYKGFQGIDVLVDVGGGIGSTLNMIVSKYPNVKGINFDLPHVVSHAPKFPGVEHVGGDMFASVPKGDAIFMKWILHDWSDEHCVSILKNCFKALPDSGKAIISESILPDLPHNTDADRTVLFGDLCMLTYNVGGKERTKKEFESLAKQAGFSQVKFVCCVYNTWIMEFYK